MSEIVKKCVKEGVKKLWPEAGILEGEIFTEVPDGKMGDVSVPVFGWGKRLQKSPNEIAESLSKFCEQSGKFVKVEAISGFVNFWLRTKDLFRVVDEILEEGEKFGGSKKRKGEKVMVEFSSPNTNKPLHIGHGRNNFVGMGVSEILKKNGVKVVRAQIFNDRGVHICKAMWVLLNKEEMKKIGGFNISTFDEWKKKRTDLKEKFEGAWKGDHYVGYLYSQYDGFLYSLENDVEKKEWAEKGPQELLKKWEEGDAEVRKLWEEMRRWFFEGVKETYKKIGSEFDQEYFESELWNEGREMVVTHLEKGDVKGLEKLPDGAVEIDLGDVKLDKKILLRKDGTTVYMTQDLETTRQKFEDFDLDESLWVVGDEQKYHFQVLFELCERFKIAPKEKCHHLAYGMVELPDGKMSSRKGTAVSLDEWILEVEELAKKAVREKHDDLDGKEIEKRGSEIAMGAVKFGLLKNGINKKVIFDPKEAVSFVGDSGPYLQYAHARICSIFREAGEVELKNVEWEKMEKEQERELVKKLRQFEKVILKAGEKMDPSLVCSFLVEVAQEFSRFYAACLVLKAESEELKKARLALCEGTKIVLKEGLRILGIGAPERM